MQIVVSSDPLFSTLAGVNNSCGKNCQRKLCSNDSVDFNNKSLSVRIIAQSTNFVKNGLRLLLFLLLFVFCDFRSKFRVNARWVSLSACVFLLSWLLLLQVWILHLLHLLLLHHIHLVVLGLLLGVHLLLPWLHLLLMHHSWLRIVLLLLLAHWLLLLLRGGHSSHLHTVLLV